MPYCQRLAVCTVLPNSVVNIFIVYLHKSNANNYENSKCLLQGVNQKTGKY